MNARTFEDAKVVVTTRKGRNRTGKLIKTITNIKRELRKDPLTGETVEVYVEDLTHTTL